MTLEQNDLLTIGELAKATSTTPRTVRFYESMGLIKPLKRSKSGYRLFGRSELRRMQFITSLKQAGFHLKVIQRLLDLKESELTASETARTANEILQTHMPEVDRTVTSVKSARNDIIRTMTLLSKCYSCDQDFETLPCGDCDGWHEDASIGLPVMLTLIWPKLKSE